MRPRPPRPPAGGPFRANGRNFFSARSRFIDLPLPFRFHNGYKTSDFRAGAPGTTLPFVGFGGYR